MVEITTYVIIGVVVIAVAALAWLMLKKKSAPQPTAAQPVQPEQTGGPEPVQPEQPAAEQPAQPAEKPPIQ